MHRPLILALLLVSLLVPLGGCALIDQTWFSNPPHVAPSVPAPPPPKFETRAPLIVIAFATPEPDYAEPLGFAVGAAQASRRAIAYDVIGMAPIQGTPNVQAQAERDAAANAAKIMRALVADGVPTSRIRLGVRSEAGLAGQEVRVFVR